MAETLRIGPARIYVAAAITDPVEDWVDLGVTRGDVIYILEPGQVALGRSDQKGRTPTADAVYRTGQRTRIKAPMLDRDIAKLVEYMPGAVKTTAASETALGFGSGFAALSPKAFAVVPVDEDTPGSPWWGSDLVAWIPQGVAFVQGPFSLALPEGEDASSVFEVEIASLADDTMASGIQDAGGIGQHQRLNAAGNVGPLGLDFLWEPEDGLSPKVGSPGTFARASTATYIDEAGVLQTAASGELRNSHYENAVRTVLLEAQRTNAWTYSEQLDNAAWAKTDVTVAADDTTAPDGAVTADRIHDGVTAGVEHYVQRTTSLPGGTDSTVQAVSFHAKSAEYTTVRFVYRDRANVTHVARVDLSDGTITVLANSPNVTATLIGNGHYRVVGLPNNASGATAEFFRIQLEDAGGNSVYDGASKGVYVWGIDYGQDASFASSYIPTVASAVTRLADSLYFPLPALIATPQEMTAGAKFVERGSIDSASGTRLFQAGKSDNNTPRFYIHRGTTGYVAFHDTTAASVSSTLTTKPVIGDVTQLRDVLGSNGVIQLHQSIGTAAETSAAASAALALAAAWSDQLLWINGVGSSAPGFNAFQQVILARRTRTLTELRAV